LVYGIVEIGQSAVFSSFFVEVASLALQALMLRFLYTDIYHIQIWHLFAGPSQAGLCLVLSMGPKQTTHTLNVVGLMM
jgi:hypothetical protein